MITAEDPDAHARKVHAPQDKLQAQAEQKLGDMAGNTDLQQSARADLDDAESRLRTRSS